MLSVGGWAETSLGFAQPLSKIMLHGNWNSTAPKTGTYITKVAYARKRAYYFFWYTAWYDVSLLASIVLFGLACYQVKK